MLNVGNLGHYVIIKIYMKVTDEAFLTEARCLAKETTLELFSFSCMCSSL